LACAITAVLVTTPDKPAQARVASRANFLSFMELSPSIVLKNQWAHHLNSEYVQT
jgi:hypothetical protein